MTRTERLDAIRKRAEDNVIQITSPCPACEMKGCKKCHYSGHVISRMGLRIRAAILRMKGGKR